MTYFTARSNLVPYAFRWEKVKTIDFFRNCCTLWYKSWKLQSTNWVHEGLWCQRSRPFIYLITRIQYFMFQVGDRSSSKACIDTAMFIGYNGAYNICIACISCINQCFEQNQTCVVGGFFHHKADLKHLLVCCAPTYPPNLALSNFS